MSVFKKIANRNFEEAGCFTSRDWGNSPSRGAKRYRRAINKAARRQEKRLAFRDQEW